MMFRVSVIIPVYNAVKYLAQAVQSCVEQDEVAEVLLIEDGSPDDALEVCLQLQRQFPIVRVLQHPNGENRGAGASRNLGLQEARCEYCAFLDADDYFLTGRFKVTHERFKTHPDADGVYEAIGYFHDGSPQKYKLFTLQKPIPPKSLLYYLLRGTYGHFSTVGFTVKRELVLQIGGFNTALKLHQDTELWLRLAYHGKLYAGELTRPVSMARKHTSNRISKANAETRLQLWDTAYRYFKQHDIGFLRMALIKKHIARQISIGRKTLYIVDLLKVFLRY